MQPAGFRVNEERPEDDFYPTPDNAIYTLLAHLSIPEGTCVHEPACGDGAISKILERHPCIKKIISTDLNDHGYGTPNSDFLTCNTPMPDWWLITNPPYKLAGEFLRKAFELRYKRVIMFLRWDFLGSSKSREDILESGQLQRVLLMKERVTLFPKHFSKPKKGTSTYYSAWYIFDRDYKAPYQSEVIVRRVSLKQGEAYAKLFNSNHQG